MEILYKTFSELEKVFENQANGIPKWQLIVGTVALTSGTLYLSQIVQLREDAIPYLKQNFFNILKRLPSINKRLKDEKDKFESDILDTMFEPDEAAYETFLQLPEKSKAAEEVLEIAKDVLNMGRYDWKGGKVSGGVMTGTNDELTDLMLKMHSIFSWSNPLHIDVFPGIRKMEYEVVHMTSKLFHGDENTIGCMTTGGSESLLMVMKAYRDWAKDVKGIEHPEVIAPDTVHSGIDKAAKILGYKFRRVKTDPKTIKFEISDFEKLVNKNTALFVASAPDFAHGVVDDVQALSRLATKYNIPLHVDCCLGGYFLPFKAAAGYPTPLFDFRLSGVTSISADTHKYGLAPKGSSVVLYSKKEYFHYQYFTVTDWPGGVYATPTIPGSRSGVNIAMCWAALLYNGFEGYVANTKKIVEVSLHLRREIRKIEDLFVFGDPVGPVVSFGSSTFNILHVVDLMADSGWHLQALQNPPGVHIYLTSLHTAEDFVDKFMVDLRTSVQVAKSDTSKKEHWAKIYGMTKSVPDESIVEDFVKVYLDAYYTSAKEL